MKLRIGAWAAAAEMIVTGLLVGCGGAAPPAARTTGGPLIDESAGPTVAVHLRGDEVAVGRMGRPGGTLELSSGARVEVPAGVLGEALEVELRRGANTTAFNNHEDTRAIGPTLQIAPPMEAHTGTKIVVSIPLIPLPDGFGPEHVRASIEDEADEQRDLSSATRTRWVEVPAEIRDGRIRAELEYLPGNRFQFIVVR